MKGQAQVVTSVATVFFVAILVLIGLTVYGTVTHVTPHDRSIYNESMCTDACAQETSYTFDNIPVLNNSAMVCSNGTGGAAMTNVGPGSDGTCLTYNILNLNALNISNVTVAGEGCYIASVACDYTYDQANTNEQNFYDDNTTTTFSAFTLAAIVSIVLAAVVIVGLVMLFRA